jgi:homoserine O-succinyltransferase
MSDEALKVTERQFRDLISASSGSIDIELRLFAFARTARSPRAFEYLSSRYEPVSEAMNGDLDGLIITGAQPRTALMKEDYWPELTETIEWAKDHTASTIFSCLAAHAAVLYLDGVDRRRLAEKCTGAFAFLAQQDHPLSGEHGSVRVIPHSRYNGLLRSELERAGYDILTSSAAHGVDMFIKSFGSLFVFLQGHPEYDPNSLAREYRRDMGQYWRGETDRFPTRPKGYFSVDAEAELDALALRMSRDRGSVPFEELTNIEALAPSLAEWRDTATAFYRSWINSLAPSATLAPEPRLLTLEAGAPLP